MSAHELLQRSGEAAAHACESVLANSYAHPLYCNLARSSYVEVVYTDGNCKMAAAAGGVPFCVRLFETHTYN